MNMPKTSGTGEQSMWNESYPPMDLTVSSIPVIPVEDEGVGLHLYPHSCRDYYYVFTFYECIVGNRFISRFAPG